MPTYVTAAFFDTINEVVYIGGPFNDIGGSPRSGLAAIDAITGNLLPWAPVVNNGTVRAIAKSGDTIFVGGTFSQINSSSRGRIAAISASTGNLFSTFSSGTGSVSDTVMALQVLGGKLYVGGRFTTIASSARTDLARLSYSGTADPWIPAVAGPVRKISRYSNLLVALADFPAVPCNGIITVSTATAAVTVRAQPDPSEYISDFALRGAVAFLTGPFLTVNSQTRSYTAACDLSNGNLTSWNPPLNLYGYDSRSRFSIAYYRDSLFIATFDVLSQQPAYHQLCVSYYNSPGNIRVMKTYQSNLTGLNGYYNDNLLAGNARLVEIERFAQHTSFPNGTISCRFYSYCLKPPNMPGPFSVMPNPVCPGDSNVNYHVISLGYFNSYVWSDNNPEVIIGGNTSTGVADFTENFSGTVGIHVYGVTSCGIISSAFRGVTVNANSVPNANAGADDTLNCITSQLVLHGTSSTAGVTFAWNGPSGNSASDSLPANLPGNYVLTVHGPNGCWKRDTTMILMDTIRPPLVAFSAVPQLTCRDTIALLDASSLYPNDSLYWSGPGLLSHNNPAAAAQSALYLLTILDRGNGCSSSDTIFVGQNSSPPSAAIVSSDSLLTCSVPSIQLSGNSALGSVTFQWTDSSGTFFNDPLNVTQPGFYQLHATDTANGCVNLSNLIFINSWYAQPGIFPLTDTAELNCSYATLQMNASSPTTGAAIAWNGPNNYSSSDSAIFSQVGYYYVTAIHPQTGCTSQDSVFVNFSMALDVQAGNDTAICPGSGAVLQAFPVGGTAPFNFSWSNNAGTVTPVTVYPPDTLGYVVTVTDAAGCSGTDTIIINVPDPLADSVLAFQPCDPLQPTGQIQVYAFHGVPPFEYSTDNGLTWNSSGIFAGLNYGNYSILIRDALGCTRNETAVIDTNSLSPQPEFLVSTGPQMGDTLVVVDISNPRPDSISWDFPSTMIVTDSNMFAPVFITTDTGAFALTMHAFYGSCEVIYTRWISIHPFDSAFATPWNANGIDSITLYPNPNNGIFTLDVQLFSRQDFVILVYDATGTERARLPVYDANHWNGQVSVPNPVPGNYVLRVIAEFDAKERTFVISQ